MHGSRANRRCQVLIRMEAGIEEVRNSCPGNSKSGEINIQVSFHFLFLS